MSFLFKERLRWKIASELGWPISLPLKGHDAEISRLENLIEEKNFFKSYLHLLLLNYKYPKNHGIFRLFAKYELKKENYRRAISFYIKASLIDENKLRNFISIAKCYDKLNNKAKVKEYLDKVKKGDLLVLESEDLITYLKLKETYEGDYLKEDLYNLLLNNKLTDVNLEVFIKKLFSIDSKLGYKLLEEVKKKKDDSFLLLKTCLYIHLKEYKEALNCFSKLSFSSIDAKLYKSLCDSFFSFFKLKDREECELFLTSLSKARASFFDENNYLLLKIIRLILDLDPPKLRQYSLTPYKEMALGFCKYTLEYAPLVKEVNIWLVKLYIRMREYDKANKVLEDYTEIKNTLTYFVLKITILLKTKDFKNYLLLLKEAKKLFPESVDLRVLEVNYFLYFNKKVEAKKIYESLLKEGVKSHIPRDYLRLLYSMGDWRSFLDASLDVDCEDLKNLSKLNSSKEVAYLKKESMIYIDSFNKVLALEDIKNLNSEYVLINVKKEEDSFKVLDIKENSFFTYRDALDENKIYAFMVKKEDLKLFLPDTVSNILENLKNIFNERVFYKSFYSV